MPQYLIRKLENFVRLSAEEKSALVRLAAERPWSVTAGEDIVCEGDPPRYIHLVLSGYACRYRVLKDGRRQIVGVFVPGDLCDQRIFVLKYLDFSIAALTDARLAQIEADSLVHLGERYPRLLRAFWWASVVGETISREWIVNVGARGAKERLAHFLCELYTRLSAVGLVRGHACDLPLTQTELADVLGISAVHTNRTLQALKAEGLIRTKVGELIVQDLHGLMNAGLFSPNYLHLEHEGRALNANG